MKFKRNVFNVITIILLIALIGGGVYLNNQVTKVKNQITYTIDNTSVILSEVQAMQDNIKATLEEEASLISSWSISLDSTDFKNQTYTVDIDVTPKEYSETTETRIFFGTQEFPLTLEDYHFVGKAELSLSEDYAGNVTVLFVDGGKRNTEVLDHYEGVLSLFDDVATGIMSTNPTYDKGKLDINSDVDIFIDGKDRFMFDDCEVVLENGGAAVRSYDIRELINANTNSMDTENTENEPLTREPTDSIAGKIILEDSIELATATDIRLYIKACTTDGYVFTYDLFNGKVNAEGDGFEDSDDYNEGNPAVSDTYGNTYIREEKKES